MIDSIMKDVRYGARMLMKRPGFTIIAVLTLALGIGANTAIFTVINAVMLRPLPYPEEERLVVLRENRTDAPWEDRGVSYPNFRDWEKRVRSFSSMGIIQLTDVTVVEGGEPERLTGAIVSAGFFRTLGIKPALGRLFRDEDDLPGGSEGAQAVMLSHSVWQSRFGGDPRIIGRRIRVQGNVLQVTGVLPEGILPLQNEPVGFWATVAMMGDPARAGTPNASRGYRAYAAVVARLKPDATIERAREELESVTAGMRAEYPESNGKSGASVIGLRDLLISDLKPMLWLLMGLVAAILLIACVNVANLMLARSLGRQREIAIMAALGAGRGRIIRQMVTEGMLLALIGGLIGLLVSQWGVDLLVSTMPADVPRITGLSPDWRVLLFTFAAAALTGIICGIAPAWQAARADVTQAMKDGGLTVSRAGSGLRNTLVIGQLALSMTILIGAGLLIKSLINLQQVNPGFETSNILTAQFVLPQERYYNQGFSPEGINLFLSKVEAEARRLPGVRDVSYAQCVPLTSNENNTYFEVLERPSTAGEKQAAQLRFIGAGYFSTIGIPVMAGRAFTAQDDPKSRPVAIVNQAFVREHLGGENPIGKRLKLGWGGEGPKEIVGVVGNVRHRSLSDDVRPEMYVPQAQFVNAGITLLVRTSGDPSTLVNPLKSIIRRLDPELPVMDVKTMNQYREESLSYPRFISRLVILFAVLGLALSVIGLYGVLSYSVSQRTGELGIRIALGAASTDILKLVVFQGLKLVALGLILGLAGSIALTRLGENQLYQVSTTDPIVLTVISLIVLIVALAACLIPARRAARVDPLVVLRSE